SGTQAYIYIGRAHIIERLKKEKNPEYVLKGNSLVLTVDKNLQQFVYDKLKGRKGSVVVMNSKTGEILSMVSYPDFNPQTIRENINSLNSDTENTPLLNRATQGLYPPASVFKIITAIAFMQESPNWKDYKYTCTGEYTVGNEKISCFNGNKHGEVDLEKALTHSCNAFFASLSEDLKPSSVKKVSEKFLFNKNFNFSLEYKTPSFSLGNFPPKGEILQTYIGQGKTLTTPLHIALIGCAIANNGVIMTPYVIDSKLNNNGETIEKTIPKQLTTATDLETSTEIRTMLEKVIEEGTGKKAQNSSVSISGKTGTAQIEGKKDHTWFLGMAPSENPSIVISIILENSGASDVVEISRDILKKALNVN
ncbi:MAG: penicillin-binding protein 2, partial [Eubacteriales bacterium]|nr:penicillin-binding protein 2 [Eubacteriales bacterium]